MANPYLPPEDNKKRVLKTSLISPLLVVMFVAIYAGYVFFYANSEETGFLAYLKAMSFEVFVLCNIGMIALILYNKRQLDDFLFCFPVIENREGLEKLKPIVRLNMYSSLFMILFLALSSLTAIMSILNHGTLKGILVAVLSVATAKLINWYNPSEKMVKNIECTDEAFEVELNNILRCWMHKPFPEF
jgi:hypothetical protein